MNKIKALIATTFLAFGLIVAPTFNGAIGDVDLDAKLTVNKTEVERGDTLTYTFRVENTLTEPLLVYLAPGMNGDHAFSPYVDYIDGSTTWTDSLGATGDIADTWIEIDPITNQTGVNLNYIDPGEWVTLSFKAKVREDAPDNAFIESVVQIKKTWLVFEDEEGNVVDPNEWIQCAARSTLTGDVLAAADELPDTGPENVIATSLLIGYVGVLLRKLKLTKYL